MFVNCECFAVFTRQVLLSEKIEMKFTWQRLANPIQTARVEMTE